MNAKRTAARRRKHEGSLGALMQPRSPAGPANEMLWREVRALLDEEIARLPEKYRTVFVLCCLEELSQAEAARRLGCKVRTVSNRLAEARKRLSGRLARRGVELTAALVAVSLAQAPVSALPIVPLAGIARTTVAPAAVALAESLSSLGGFGKTKMATVILLAVSLLSGAGVYFLASPQRQQGQPLLALRAGKESADVPRSAKRDEANSVEIQGRVLAPEGKPKAGAKLVLLDKDGEVKQLSVSVADGRFSVTVPKTPEGRGLSPVLLAHSGDVGLDFVRLAGLDAAKPVELRLVKDHTIRGRVLNTEGQPIRGVRVSVVSIDVYPNNSLETFLIRWQKRPADYALPHGEKTVWFRAASILAADTDAEGRFAISGVGIERVAEIEFQGGGIASTWLWIANRDGFDFRAYNRPADDAYRSGGKRMNAPAFPNLLQGPNVHIVAEPEKPIRGVVKDADSGKGIPNVPLRLDHSYDAPRRVPVAKTDTQGRFEFHGARKTKMYNFHVESDSSAAYLTTHVDVPDTVGFSPLDVQIPIKKGVIVTGKIIDKATGKSVLGFAQSEVLVDNPFVKDYRQFYSRSQRNTTAADGTFRVVTIPGPVLLMGGFYPPTLTEKFDYIEFSKYRPSVADLKYPQYFSKLPDFPGRPPAYGFNAYPQGIGLLQGNYCKVLDIKPGTAVVHQDILLERASVLEVKIQDAEGRPVIGVWATDFATHTYIGPLWIERSTCPVYGLEERKSRLLIFYEPKKKIIASRRLQGDEKGPIVVKLGAMGTIKGRLLDAAGNPLAGVAVDVNYRERDPITLHQVISEAKQSVTDATGAFTIDELIPEMKFDLSVCRGKQQFEREAKNAESVLQLKPGECRDLGAIKMKLVPAVQP
jgi:hypothetical protein